MSNSNNKNNKPEAKDILYADSIKEREKKKERNDLINKLGNELTQAQILYAGLDELKQIYGAIKSFGKNYHDVKEANTKYSDKYFHAKANCEAAQYGKTGAKVASFMSDLRENIDIPKNMMKPDKKTGKKMKNSEIIEDYRDDHYANLYGRCQGANNPKTDCKILVDKYRPNGLNNKY